MARRLAGLSVGLLLLSGCAGLASSLGYQSRTIVVDRGRVHELYARALYRYGFLEGTVATLCRAEAIDAERCGRLAGIREEVLRFHQELKALPEEQRLTPEAQQRLAELTGRLAEILGPAVLRLAPLAL